MGERPCFGTLFGTLTANESNIAYVSCMTREDGERAAALPLTGDQSLKEPSALVAGKTKSQARGLGCCLALLSTAFNMTEHNSESDHIDRKLLTMSGEKVIFHCGIFCISATHAMK